MSAQQQSLQEVLHELFGLRSQGICPFCKKKIDPKQFKDELSKKEFKISGLCQKCQDDFFTIKDD